MILVVHPRPWNFSSGILDGSLFFSKPVFGRVLELPKLRNLRKKVARLYGSTRPLYKLPFGTCLAFFPGVSQGEQEGTQVFP